MSDTAPETTPEQRLRGALAVDSASDRLQAALTAGTYPQPEYVEALVERCAIEPDFSVREMLTWALTRHPVDLVVPLAVGETRSVFPQARSQALHTLSKVGDARGWEAITPELLADEETEVARTAWRAAALLAPDASRAALVETLATQLGRGERETRFSLSRALGVLGDVARPALEAARGSHDSDVRTHAVATLRMLDDPDESFDTAVWEAQRAIALGE